MISLLTIISFSTFSQSIETDSVYQKKLRQFIDEYYFLDSAYTSALKELQVSDSIIDLQERSIFDLKEVIYRKEEIISALRQKITDIEGSKLPWYIYTAGGGLVLIIGILTGLIVK